MSQNCRKLYMCERDNQTSKEMTLAVKIVKEQHMNLYKAFVQEAKDHVAKFPWQESWGPREETDAEVIQQIVEDACSYQLLMWEDEDRKLNPDSELTAIHIQDRQGEAGN